MSDKPAGSEKKIAAGILGILLGGLGIHKFILGYTKEGVIMLAVWIVGFLLFGLGPMIMGIIGLIEGIIRFSIFFLMMEVVSIMPHCIIPIIGMGMSYK